MMKYHHSLFKKTIFGDVFEDNEVERQKNSNGLEKRLLNVPNPQNLLLSPLTLIYLFKEQ